MYLVHRWINNRGSNNIQWRHLVELHVAPPKQEEETHTLASSQDEGKSRSRPFHKIKAVCMNAWVWQLTVTNLLLLMAFVSLSSLNS